MSRLKLAAMLVTFATLVGIVIWQLTQIGSYKAQTAALKEQLEQTAAARLIRENQVKPQPNLQPSANPTASLPQDQFRELLRLRGDVGVLKQRLSEALQRTANAESQQQHSATLLDLKLKCEVAKQYVQEQSLVNTVKVALEELRSALNVPEEVTKLDPREASKIQDMDKYSPYFRLKFQCEQMEKAVEDYKARSWLAEQ
ncbi:MAG TPA: hypothetical protein VEC99_06595 [Clostridia bacterium]|nr:hypothetical protein [Clostridia bacterium]